jgi:hypothetical protein
MNRATKLISSSSPFSRGLMVVVLVAVVGVGVYVQSFSHAAAPVGDVNGDNTVNVSDLSLLLANWGKTTAADDLNKDGTVNIFDLSLLLSNWGKVGTTTTPTPTVAATPTPAPTSSGTAGRSYPLHTNINSTTYWVGEQFQATADGSQVCSAYDSKWQFSFFHLNTGPDTSQGCTGAPLGGCDALRSNPSGPCDDTNSISSLRTPANGYWPAGLPQIYESPFYLDLPVDDYNASGGGVTTSFSNRCSIMPWANDAGYAGHCTDTAFSYMKNRFVKIMANGQTCYGQIEDAGPADVGAGNGNYADSNYVFSTTDARPYNKSYNSAGMDVSPALSACLHGTFNADLTVNWQFVDAVDVPAGPWKTIVTTTKPQ